MTDRTRMPDVETRMKNALIATAVILCANGLAIASAKAGDHQEDIAVLTED